MLLAAILIGPMCLPTIRAASTINVIQTQPV
jgi:hypothetical protein